MRRVPRTASAGLIGVVFVAALSALPAADARSSTLTIQAGAVHPTNGASPYVYTRFYPDVATVHRGQTLRWTFPQTHSVTFSKSGRPSWYRPDEIPDTYAVNERFGFGSTDCGFPDLKACSLTASTKYLSSGVSRIRQGKPFAVTVDAPPGRYTYFCTLHPTMSGTIEVVGAGRSVPTQQRVSTRTASQIRADTKAADAVFRADQKPVSEVNAEGQRVWRGLLGDSTADGHVSIIAFMPAGLEIGAGDRVRWVFREHAVNEPHTVTFPTEISGGPPGGGPVGLGTFGLYLSCDLDSPTGGMKGIPGLWGAPPVPACPGTLEIAHAPWMTRGHPAPGNEVLTPATYHDSGLLVATRSSRSFRVLPDTGRTLPSTFEAEFPTSGAFTFECNLHVDLMTGSIDVS